MIVASTGSQHVLTASRVSLRYGEQQVLRDVDLSVPRAQTVAVTGPSGSGKTTLLYCLSGLERPQQGTIELLGQDVVRSDGESLARLRLRQVGFVFQSADLVPELTLRQNLALPLELAGASRRDVRDRTGELVALLGLQACADRRPGLVSGGQAQRCAVGRAVVARPAVVFADEPTGALDSVNRDTVLDLLLTQVRDVGASLVMVTHDDHVASLMDRRVDLADGRVVRDDVPAPLR